MRARWRGDNERYQGLKNNTVYEIDFHTEHSIIIVEVATVKREDIATFVFPDFQTFIDSWSFEGVKKPNRRMRKLTDFDTTKFFTTGEVAELFGVHVNTVDRWVKSGRLSYSHRLPSTGHRRYAREECMKLYETMLGGEYE